ncbi:hypothetical protein LXL04_038511 [Taraxacum kok-saghyz]
MSQLNNSVTVHKVCKSYPYAKVVFIWNITDHKIEWDIVIGGFVLAEEKKREAGDSGENGVSDFAESECDRTFEVTKEWRENEDGEFDAMKSNIPLELKVFRRPMSKPPLHHLKTFFGLEFWSCVTSTLNENKITNYIQYEKGREKITRQKVSVTMDCAGSNFTAKKSEKPAKSRRSHRRGQAARLCRWQSLPLENAIPPPTPAVNSAKWHTAGRILPIPSSLNFFSQGLFVVYIPTHNSRYSQPVKDLMCTAHEGKYVIPPQGPILQMA